MGIVAYIFDPALEKAEVSLVYIENSGPAKVREEF